MGQSRYDRKTWTTVCVLFVFMSIFGIVFDWYAGKNDFNKYFYQIVNAFIAMVIGFFLTK